MLTALLATVMLKPEIGVLVFSKTAGFRHDSIPAGHEAMRKLAQQHGWKVESTEDAAVFTDANLKRFKVVVFLCTTGDVLNEAQEKAFEGFISGGGGWVGIHSATDTEYGWPWYGEMIGGAYFKSHPHIQPADIIVEDKHPTVAMLPPIWKRTDEWYCFRANPRGKVDVHARLDTKTYQGSTMGEDHPVIWSREVAKGRAWYTAGGHTKESYSEDLFLKHVAAGVNWAARR